MRRPTEQVDVGDGASVAARVEVQHRQVVCACRAERAASSLLSAMSSAV
jgi:hypothetical protein